MYNDLFSNSVTSGGVQRYKTRRTPKFDVHPDEKETLDALEELLSLVKNSSLSKSWVPHKHLCFDPRFPWLLIPCILETKAHDHTKRMNVNSELNSIIMERTNETLTHVEEKTAAKPERLRKAQKQRNIRPPSETAAAKPSQDASSLLENKNAPLGNRKMLSSSLCLNSTYPPLLIKC